MHITVVTPAGAASRAGNRATAIRWGRFLKMLGHRVHISTDYTGEPTDVLLALHAWRSAAAVRRFRAHYPERPLIVALTGTDIYRYQYSHARETLESMAAADVLIGLHDRVQQAIPACFVARLQRVFQSAEPVAARLDPDDDVFDVCVIGHLREEKDPLRAALAVRDLPPHSRLRVIQAGKAHTENWAQQATEEMVHNRRYQWCGEVSAEEVGQLMARSRVMVISSVMEGGANVVSEACVAGLPVIASDIAGNRGLLGDDYPGYFPVQETEALRNALLRAEADPHWLEGLRAMCVAKAALFRPEEEQRSLGRAIERAIAQAGSTQ